MIFSNSMTYVIFSKKTLELILIRFTIYPGW